RDARTAGTQPLGERALWVELQLQLAAQVLALELLVLADVGRNHLANLAGLEELAKAEAIDPSVVRDHGQVLDTRIAQRGDQGLGDAAQAETADREGLAVGHQSVQRDGSISIELASSHGVPR